ncbi:MAG: hypothetical protein IJ356_02680 [Erysipelotrichaceae bacterium]|nr:hypothetical protein [Erysipelotrichaceae bacterium]
MKKLICVLLISLLMIGCLNSKQLFSEKKVTMDDQIIEFPMALSEFIKLTNADLTFRGGSVLGSRDYVVLTSKDFQIGVYNDGKTEKALEDCVVIGIMQSLKQVENGAEKIEFPEQLSVGMQSTVDELTSLFMKTGGIYGDTHIGEGDDESVVLCGKRWMDLSSDWNEVSGNVLYPVRIVLEKDVITKIEMIFLNQISR